MNLSESRELEDFKLKGQLYLEQVKLANALAAEEIKSLRSQEESLEKENRTIELHVVGALLAYYAWLIYPDSARYGAGIGWFCFSSATTAMLVSIGNLRP